LIGDALPCTGKGKCFCAKCQCDDGFSGEYCQFDDSNCYQNGHKHKCNGNNGICKEEKCQCNSEYTGNFCECPRSNHTCIAPNSTSVIIIIINKS
jgi:hypothetical protein